MTEGANRMSMAKNWADEIDDLHNDATQRRLKSAFFYTSMRQRAAEAEATDARVAGGPTLERGQSARGLAQ